MNLGYRSINGEQSITSHAICSPSLCVEVAQHPWRQTCDAELWLRLPRRRQLLLRRRSHLFASLSDAQRREAGACIQYQQAGCIIIIWRWPVEVRTSRSEHRIVPDVLWRWQSLLILPHHEGRRRWACLDLDLCLLVPLHLLLLLLPASDRLLPLWKLHKRRDTHQTVLLPMQMQRGGSIVWQLTSFCRALFSSCSDLSCTPQQQYKQSVLHEQ
jgi:hypothetical protein